MLRMPLMESKTYRSRVSDGRWVWPMAAAMLVASAAAWAQMGPGMMMGGGGGGMGGQQQKEEPDMDKPVDQLQFAIDQYLAAFAILEGDAAKGGQGGAGGGGMGGAGGGGMMGGMGGGQSAAPQPRIEDQDLRRSYYTKIWDAYQLIADEYRKRDQVDQIETVMDEALSTFPNPLRKSQGGGMGGGMMGGPGGGMGGGMMGPMGGGRMMRQAPGMMGPGGPGMMGGGMGGGGMGGMGGGGSSLSRGSQMAEWDKLRAEEQQWLKHNVLAFAYDAYGVAKLQQGDTEGALAEFLNIIEGDGDKLGVFFRDGFAHAAQVEVLLGQDDDAIRHLNALTAPIAAASAVGPFTPAPTSPVAWANKGMVLTRLGRYREAVPALRQSLLIDPENKSAGSAEAHVVAHSYLGITYLRMGKQVEAEQEFKGVLGLVSLLDQQTGAQPRYSEFRRLQRMTLAAAGSALNNLGIIYQQQGRHDESLTYHRSAADLADRLVMLEQRDLGATVDDHQRAQEVRAELLGNYGIAEIIAGADAQQYIHGVSDPDNAKGKLETAVVALEQAVMADAQSGAAWNNLGVAYMRTGRFFEAEAAFQRATSLAGNLEYRWNLAAVDDILGGPGGAAQGGGMGMMGGGMGMMGGRGGPAGAGGPGMMGGAGGPGMMGGSGGPGMMGRGGPGGPGMMGPGGPGGPGMMGPGGPGMRQGGPGMMGPGGNR